MLSDHGHSPPVRDAVLPKPRSTELPSRLRLLWVGPEEPSWVSLTLQLDAEGCLEPQFHWVSTPGEALCILRNESFDCILVSDGPEPRGADFPVCQQAGKPAPLLSLLRAIRASGYDDPVILIVRSLGDQRWAEVCDYDCDVLVTSSLSESLALVPVMKRAISRVELSRENRRLAIANHRRLLRERDEAAHLLGQQRQIVEELEALVARSPALSKKPRFLPTLVKPSTDEAQSIGEESREAAGPEDGPVRLKCQLPQEIDGYYHELLRTYVIMGSGSLSREIAKLAELLSLAGLSPREVLELHLQRVETIVRGLGNRSARHVMSRADLLALELMMHLGECYQRGVDHRFGMA